MNQKIVNHLKIAIYSKEGGIFCSWEESVFRWELIGKNINKDLENFPGFLVFQSDENKKLKSNKKSWNDKSYSSDALIIGINILRSFERVSCQVIWGHHVSLYLLFVYTFNLSYCFENLNLKTLKLKKLKFLTLTKP